MPSGILYLSPWTSTFPFQGMSGLFSGTNITEISIVNANCRHRSDAAKCDVRSVYTVCQMSFLWDARHDRDKS